MFKILVTNKKTKKSKYFRGKSYKTLSGAKRGITCYFKSADKNYLFYPKSRYDLKPVEVKS